MFKTILRFVRTIFFLLFDSIACFRKNTLVIAVARTLIIRTDNIGDFVLWLPSAQKICEHYSENGKPFLICNQTCVDFAKATELFIEVIGIDLRQFNLNLFYRWSKLRDVSRIEASIAIQPTYSRAFLSGDSLVRASRAKSRIGSQGDNSNIRSWQKVISDRWYTRLIEASPQPMMELERNTEFLRNLGITNTKTEIPSIPKLQDLPPEKTIQGNYFVLFPGASSIIRQWSVEKFSDVAIELVGRCGWTPVICGGPGDRILSDQLLMKLNAVSGKNLAGQTSLPELAEVIRGARLLISNETSAIHIAAGVQTPSVCILGGGHYGRFMPYPENLKGMKPTPAIKKMDCFGCNWRCTQTVDSTMPYPCVEDIEVVQVMEAVDEALDW